MHKFLLITILLSTFSFAQEVEKSSPFNKLSIDGGLGFNNAISPFSSGYSNDKFNLFTLNLGGRYMLNNKFGMKLDLGYNQFHQGKNSLNFNSHLLTMSFQGVVNVASLLQFNTFSTRLGFLAHGGFGFSSLSGEKLKVLKGGDEMIHLVFGITPQYKINEKVAIYGDVSMMANYKQHYNFDHTSTTPADNRRGSFANLTFGISYKLGSAEKHLDWVFDAPTPKEEVNLTATEERVKAIEEGVKDDDKDGVLNMYDLEPATPEGAIVNTKGQKVNPDVVEEVKDTASIGKVVGVIKEDVKIDEKPIKDVSGTKSINGMDGLFFTVQVGAYNYFMKVESHKKLDQVYMITLPDGKIRFCTGVFASDKEAYPLVYKARGLGFTDAFLTAYYKGERIPIYKARELLKEHGPSILDPAVKK
ncbi:MAG: outer membrane beta-barrel protein [Flavobacteriia bacterium]|nr:outer membrane beta-barrel protein [Flavobacteriia bacterium]